MAKFQLLDEADAKEQIANMLENFKMSEDFSKYAIGPEARLVHASRSADGKSSTLEVRLQVGEDQTNGVGTMHGGCIATVVDCITSLNLLFHTSGEIGEPWTLMGVTTSLNCTYLSGSPLGSWISVVSTAENVGRTMAVIGCTVYDAPGPDGPRGNIKRVTATHTKFDNSYRMGSEKSSKL